MQNSDRLKVALTNFIESVSPNFDFYALNPGTVVGPGANANTFDFMPDSPSLPGLQNVAFKSGIPGVTITVNPAEIPRCYLGFEAGNPKAPYLALWANPGLLSLQIAADGYINLNAPIVALGPAWTTFLSVTSTAATAPQIATAASALLTLIQSVQAA